MRIAIVIPAYITNWNHRDFLNKTTASIATSHEYAFIPVLNCLAEQFRPYQWQFTQHPNELHVLEGRQPQGVTKAWNDGIAKAIELGCEYILILNDDIVLKHDAIDTLVVFAQAHPEASLWSMGAYHDLFGLEQAGEDENFSEHPNFSAFMVYKTFPEVFGRFDENILPAYFEDSCAHARIALANQKAYVYGGAKFYHFGSRTINSDEEFRQTMPPLFQKNANYFFQKYGHTVVGEVDQMREVYYQHPYNIPELALNEMIPDFWAFLERHHVSSIGEIPKQVVLDYVRGSGLR